MSNPQVKNQAVPAPKPQEAPKPEAPPSSNAPSSSVRNLARANSVAQYGVTVPSNAYNVANVGESEVVLISSDVPDGEVQEELVVSYARHASFRRFTSGGQTRQASQELGTQSANPEGHSLSDSSFEPESDAEATLQVGINRFRGGFV